MDLQAIEPNLETFTARDGVPLRVRIVPADGSVRGWILWIHGGCEHGGRYGHVTEVLSADGWSILLPDHRGHGLSGGERTDVDRYETYLDDLMDLQKQYCPQGQADVVLGHSFGGLLAVRLVQTRMQPAALILSAPLLRLKLPVPAWKRLIGQLLVLVAPQTRFRTNIDPKNMTSDPEFLERRYRDSLLIRSVTARWFFEMQKALNAAQRDAGQITCAILAFQGLQDRTVDPAAIAEFLPRTSSADRTLVELPDHVHEVLQDSDWRATLQRMMDWLDQRLPPDEE